MVRANPHLQSFKEAAIRIYEHSWANILWLSAYEYFNKLTTHLMKK
jgi:hypothetical protein